MSGAVPTSLNKCLECCMRRFPAVSSEGQRRFFVALSSNGIRPFAADPGRLCAWSLNRFFALSSLLLLLAFVSVWSPTHAAQDDAGRDAWQRPEQVMDVLGVRAGSVVGDVGCGEGYFVLHLARRVGPEGTVYAVDTDEQVLSKLRRRLNADNLRTVRLIHSRPDDPLLPEAALDAALVVNAYHEMREYDAMLGGIRRALKPGGRLAIIDTQGDQSKDRSALWAEHLNAEKIVLEDAARAGLIFRSREPGFVRPQKERRNWFFLVFEKPEK